MFWDHAFLTKSQFLLLKKIKLVYIYFNTVANLFFINVDDFVVILSKFGWRQRYKTTKFAIKNNETIHTQDTPKILFKGEVKLYLFLVYKVKLFNFFNWISIGFTLSTDENIQILIQK